MKRSVSILSLLLLFVVVISGCAKIEPAKEKLFPVKTVELKPKNIASTIILGGTIDSKAHSWAYSPIEGSIQSLETEVGNTVVVGQILCYIISAEQQNMLGQARSDLDSTPEADNETAGLKMKEAKERYETAKKLNKPVPVVSSINGFIISKTIEVGNNVSAKQVLFEIADTHRMIIRSAVSENYVSLIRMGQRAKVIVSSLDRKEFQGIITQINPGINPATRTADIEVSFPEDRVLMMGMTVSVELAVAQKQRAIVVPQDAIIIKPNGDKIAFIVRNSKAVMVKVETGIQSNTEAEALSGLTAGDRLVVTGQEGLKDGVKLLDGSGDVTKLGNKK